MSTHRVLGHPRAIACWLTAILTVAVLGIQGCGRDSLSPNAAPLPPPPPTSGASELGALRIFFSAPYQGHDIIYLMNGAGRARTRFNDNPLFLNYYWPAVSPDGSRIVFVMDGDVDHQGEADMYVMEANGSDLHRLTFLLDPAQPAWSPDGTRIAFTRYNHEGIWVMNADGTDAVRVTDRVGDADPAWSPDGRQIAFTAISRGDAEYGFPIYIVNADGTGLHPVITWLYASAHPVWSPDGKRIAFMGVPVPGPAPGVGAGQVYVMNRDGTGPFLQLTEGSLPAIARAWSGDGKWILFTRAIPPGQDFRTGIYVTDLGWTEVRLLTITEGVPRTVAFWPMGASSTSP